MGGGRELDAGSRPQVVKPAYRAHGQNRGHQRYLEDVAEPTFVVVTRPGALVVLERERFLRTDDRDIDTSLGEVARGRGADRPSADHGDVIVVGDHVVVLLEKVRIVDEERSTLTHLTTHCVPLLLCNLSYERWQGDAGPLPIPGHSCAPEAAGGVAGMDAASERVRIRAGGRSEKVRQAVGEAALAFLAEGQLAFTVVDVAARAGVGRRTVYRWWPTREDLLKEALEAHVRRVPTVEDSGSWERDLRALAHRLAQFAADPVEIALAQLMAGGQHLKFNQMVLAQWQPTMESWRRLVQKAIERGDVAAERGPGTVIDTLLAPIFYSPLSLQRSMTRAEVDALVDLLLSGTRAR